MLTGHSELDDAASHLVVTCKTDCRELKLRQVNTALGIRKFVDEDYNGLIKGIQSFDIVKKTTSVFSDDRFINNIYIAILFMYRAVLERSQNNTEYNVVV